MRFGDGDLEEKLDKLKLKNQVAEEELSLREKKIIVSQLKKKYGKGWRQILGSKGKDSEFLRQFANVGKKMSDIGGGKR